MHLVELAREHENLVVLDADLAAATKTVVFKKAYPERFIDCGIAEANMTGDCSRTFYMWKGSIYAVHLRCLQQEEHLSRYAILSDIRI